MNYLNVQQTIDLLNKDLPQNTIPYGMTQLAELCRNGHTTPLFYYSKCLDRIDPNYDPEHDCPISIKPCTFSGYLSADSFTSLANLINEHTGQPVKLHNATVYEIIKAGYSGEHAKQFVKGDKVALCSTAHDGHPQNVMTTYDLKEHDAATVTLNDLLFHIEQVQDYIALQQVDDLTTPEQQRIAELESEVIDLKEQLSRQADTPADDDKELTYKSQEAVSRLLNVLFYKASMSIDATDGTTNTNIYNYSRKPSVDTPISKNFISSWIKRVQQLRIETGSK